MSEEENKEIAIEKATEIAKAITEKTMSGIEKLMNDFKKMSDTLIATIPERLEKYMENKKELYT